MAPFSERERLLLGAALCPDPEVATANWTSWASRIELEEAPYPELRLLTAVYANLSRIAGGFKLPDKLKGKARATFIQNNLLARESLPTIEALSRHCPLLITKGLAMCVRFNAWSSRVMGDADIHVPVSSLEAAAAVMREMGWTPVGGMTWDSLVHRSALRRSSWNFVNGQARIDLHWRPQPETSTDDIARGMWASSELHDCYGQQVRLQSVEYALATAIAHGFKYGTQGDKAQTIVDASSLLKECRPDLLAQVIDAFNLQQQMATVLSVLKDSGASVPATAIVNDMKPDSQHQEPMEARSGISAGPVTLPETPVLRHPLIYRLWEATGRRARIEQVLLRWTGPFSKPLAWSGLFQSDYDLCDCRAVDAIAGPGWAWPGEGRGGFWSDRADARLLLPLRGGENYMVVLGLGEYRAHTSNPQIDVFANGYYLTRIDLKREPLTSQYCFLISRAMLYGPWVELSFRPSPFRDSQSVTADTYELSRSIPVSRLRIYEPKEVNVILSHQDISQLHLRILGGEEPEAGKFHRIRERMQNSSYRNSKDLPEGFDPVFYVLSHRDLFESEVDPYEHFLWAGRYEERAWR